MSARRWTPEFILSRDWSFAALRRMARDCRDPTEGEAVLAAFWRKVERGPQRHAGQILPMLVASVEIVTARGRARAVTQG